MPLVEHALTDVTGIKQHIDIDMDGRNDVLIENLINGFSTYAQGLFGCNREFIKKVRTEYFSRPKSTLWVEAPPIWETSDLEVWDDVEREFTDPDRKLVLYSDYDVNWKSGVIRSPYSFFSAGIKNVKVKYMGGMFLEGQAPEDLKTACELQVTWWFKRRDNYGIRQTDGQLGTVSYFNPTDILPAVKQTLSANRAFR